MKEILSSLVKLANHLDQKGYTEEANFADGIIREMQASLDKQAEYKEAPAEEAEVVEEMMPMKDDKEMEEAESCVMKDAEANLKKVQMRRRARRRSLLVKKS